MENLNNYSAFIEKLVQERDEAKKVRNETKTQDRANFDAYVKQTDAVHKLDHLYDQVMTKINKDASLDINTNIYGLSFKNNLDKIIKDSNKGHIYEDFSDAPELFEYCDKNEMETETFNNEQYEAFLDDLYSKFCANSNNDEETLNNPELYKWFAEKRKNNQVSFLPNKDKKDLKTVKDSINLANIKLPTEEEIKAQEAKDKKILESSLKAARRFVHSPKRMEYHPDRVSHAIQYKGKNYGIEAKEDAKVLTLLLAQKHVDSKALNEIAENVDKELPISKRKGLDAVKKHPVCEKIQATIQGIEKGEINVPEGVSKEELINSLRWSDENLYDRIQENFAYVNEYGGNLDSFSQRNEEIKKYDFLKDYQNGKFHNIFEKEEENEEKTRNNLFLGTIVGNLKEGKNDLMEEYKSMKPKFSKEYKDKVTKIFHKFQEMYNLPKGEMIVEEQGKVYGFRNVANSKANLIQAINEGNLKDIPKLQKQYEKDYNDVKEIFDTIKTFNVTTAPANVGSERNAAIPQEFTSDYETQSIFNSFYILYGYLNEKNISIEDYLDDPGRSVKTEVDAVIKEKGLKGMGEKYLKNENKPYGKACLLVYLDGDAAEDDFKTPANIVANSSVDRGLIGIIDGNPDKESQAQNLAYMHMLNAVTGTNAVSRESDLINQYFSKDPDALQNFMLVRNEDVDLYKHKGEPYYASDGQRIVNPPFDRQGYILEHDMTAEEIYNDSLEVIASIPLLQDEELDGGLFDPEKYVTNPMLATMKNFNEYLIANPEAVNTPMGKKMLTFLKDPVKVVKSNECLKKHGVDLDYDRTNEITAKVNKLNQKLTKDRKEAQVIRGEYKKLIEDPFVKSEKEFNKIATKMISNINKLMDKVNNGVDVDRNTDLLVQEQNKYKLFVADRTLELMDRYKIGQLPKEYVLNRTKDMENMNIKEEKKIDLFKYSTPKEKNLFEKQYRDIYTKGIAVNNPIPEEFNPLDVTLANPGTDKLISTFTQEERKFINNSYNKDLYNYPKDLQNKYFEALGVHREVAKPEEPVEEVAIEEPKKEEAPKVEANPHRVQIHIDLGENKEERLSQVQKKGNEPNLEKKEEKDNLIQNQPSKS